MQTNIETLENCKTILTLKADKDEWKSKIEKAYNKLETKVSIPGFRKGKAPKELLRSKVNLEDVFNEALNAFLNENYSKALSENKLRPLIQPTVDVTKISMEEVECKLTIIGEPEVKLGRYKGIKIEKDIAKVDDSDIDEAINNLQKQNAEIVVKENGNVAAGDIATIDFEGFVDGVAFDGGKATDYDLEIGSNTFIPGFEDQIVGMAINETRDINVKFPTNYAPQLQGKDATFKVQVKAIKSKIYPEINDDLALDANFENVENLEQLKEYYRKQITLKKEEEASKKAYNKLIDVVIGEAEVKIAKEIIEDEKNSQVKRFEQSLSQQGLDFESYCKMIGMDKDEYLSKIESDSKKNLEYLFTLLAIAKEEKIEVTDKDFDKAYQDMAMQYGMSAEDVKKALSNRVEALANDLLVQKVSEFLKTENNI